MVGRIHNTLIFFYIVFKFYITWKFTCTFKEIILYLFNLFYKKIFINDISLYIKLFSENNFVDVFWNHKLDILIRK